MLAAGQGTTYSVGTVVHPTVSAVALSTDGLTLTAKAKGTVGNAITLAETGGGFSFAGAATTLSGGVDATAAEFTTALVATTPANVGMERISANEVLFTDNAPSGFSQARACTETLAGANNGWAAANSYGFEGIEEKPKAQAVASRVPNALEITLGSVHIPLAFVPTKVLVQVRVTATGAAKAWGGLTTIVGKRVQLTNNASTDFAATDTITIWASE